VHHAEHEDTDGLHAPMGAHTHDDHAPSQLETAGGDMMTRPDFDGFFSAYIAPGSLSADVFA